MAKKILVILTSADKMGDTEEPIGWYLPELAHPYKALVDAGFIIESVSPKGGKAPVVSNIDKYRSTRSQIQYGAVYHIFVGSAPLKNCRGESDCYFSIKIHKSFIIAGMFYVL